VDNAPLADEAAAEALAVLRRTLDGIDAMAGSQAKTQAIRELAEAIQELYSWAAEIRKGEMFRIRDEEQLSLAKLADRVGISKARADQLIKAAQQKEESDA
jgi:predicted translin family RNA/ssDNA-binding protein